MAEPVTNEKSVSETEPAIQRFFETKGASIGAPACFTARANLAGDTAGAREPYIISALIALPDSLRLIVSR